MYYGKTYHHPEEVEKLLNTCISEMLKHKGTIKAAKRAKLALWNLPMDYTVTKEKPIELPRNDLKFDDDDL